jgi:GTPase
MDSSFDHRARRETCIIIHPIFQRKPIEAQKTHKRDLQDELDEIQGLARAIQLSIQDTFVRKIYDISPSTLLGEGSIASVKELCPEECSVIIVNFALSPVQQRNLERAWQRKVIDRTGLILEIFGARAQTKEGKIQVELAALNYQRSRLVRSWTHLERQRGGAGFMGGPGETQIELDRRMIDDKIVKLKKQLQTVRRTRDLARQNREKVPYPIVSLVGYTNAGKSTLFNHLTGAGVFAEDLPFATLDPTLRLLTLPKGTEVILSDTVGFISDLPTHLIEAFRATLEQVVQADIILHVRDVSSSDTDSQREDVIAVLQDLSIDYFEEDRIVEVLNKVDKISDDHIVFKERDFKGASFKISALTGQGLPDLLSHIEEKLTHHYEEIFINIPVTDGKTISWIHDHAIILEKQTIEDYVAFKLRVNIAKLGVLKSKVRSN